MKDFYIYIYIFSIFLHCNVYDDLEFFTSTLSAKDYKIMLMMKVFGFTDN